MRQRLGYTVWANEVKILQQGEIAIVWRDAEEWGIEGVQNFGPNVLSFIITSGQKHWCGVRSYGLPNYLPTINWIGQALECRPKGVGNMLVGDLNACLENPRDQQEKQLATVLAGHGLTDQAQQFSPRQKYRLEGNWAWRIWREKRPVSGRADYI